MKCIYCNKPSKVTNTISGDNEVIRRRQCKSCNGIFYTRETVEDLGIRFWRIANGKEEAE